MKKPTKKQLEAIARNKREGLLCACNKTKVPYGEEPEHGHNIVDGIVHGYHDCRPIAEFIEDLIYEVLEAKGL